MFNHKKYITSDTCFSPVRGLSGRFISFKFPNELETVISRCVGLDEGAKYGLWRAEIMKNGKPYKLKHYGNVSTISFLDATQVENLLDDVMSIRRTVPPKSVV